MINIESFQKEIIETFQKTTYPFNQMTEDSEKMMLQAFVDIAAKIATIAICKYHEEYNSQIDKS